MQQSVCSALDSATLCCDLGCVQALAVAGVGCSKGAWARQIDGGSSGDVSDTAVQCLACSACLVQRAVFILVQTD